MIYGIVASEQEVIPPQPPVVPPGAVGSADFINGIYVFNDTVTDISDFIEVQTGLTINENGINLIAAEPVIDIIGALRTKLITFNWTFVFEVSLPDAHIENTLFHLYTETVVFGYTNEVYAEVNWTPFAYDHNSDVGSIPGSGVPMERWADDSGNELSSGIHRIAVTRTNDRLAMATDGNTVIVNTDYNFGLTWNGDPLATVFGGFAYGPATNITNSFFIRSLAIYDPVSDSDLSALTALV